MYNLTPLHEAVGSGNLEVAQLLLSHGANANAFDHQGDTLLHKAVRLQELDVVKLLLKCGADANVRGTSRPTPLHETVGSGNLEFAQLLLSHGADVNALDYFGDSPLHEALHPRNIGLSEFPVDSDPDVIAWRNQCFMLWLCASQQRNYATAQLLLEHGADVNSRGWHHNPLYLASLGGSLDLSRLLIEHGADIDAQDDDGRTPFSIALANGHRKLARFLSNDRAPGHDAKRLWWVKM
jgi:ankyrin repeat protein